MKSPDLAKIFFLFPFSFFLFTSPAAECVLSPAASGRENRLALQAALDRGGVVTVTAPGRYKVDDTILIGSDTTFRCGPGVVFVKTDEGKRFSQIIMNKGALTRTYDEHIVIDGFSFDTNGMCLDDYKVYGLRGQMGFFYVKDLKITHLRVKDFGPVQFCLHVCTFEDLIVEDAILDGEKDGIHLGRGKRFVIRDCSLETGDDPIALNAHDYAESNPEMGWIEDGVIENIHERQHPTVRLGYFCRILAGAWTDWREGMEVRQSDTVVANGRMYRFRMSDRARGKTFVSKFRPTHAEGTKLYGDGCEWTVTQTDVCYTAGCRNIAFRNIFLHHPRGVLFSLHYDNDEWSRSYYPGAEVPIQKNITFDNVNILHGRGAYMMDISSPVDSLFFANCDFSTLGFRIIGDQSVGPTRLTMLGCRFRKAGEFRLFNLEKTGSLRKPMTLKTMLSQCDSDDLRVTLPTNFTWRVDSDLNAQLPAR